ncbi:hypothetical protein DY000_02061187 [Brassica cretica]|uniref:Uncharacterized protein n=1 Tax=Brassica cretica TaxID=69181 RepID=A0ABQ7APH7_BRACR|nr:hypothetical protein DY000_02061187 [Brassica cretica]
MNNTRGWDKEGRGTTNREGKEPDGGACGTTITTVHLLHPTEEECTVGSFSQYDLARDSENKSVEPKIVRLTRFIVKSSISFGSPINPAMRLIPSSCRRSRGTPVRSDKVSTARLRENDAVRLIDQPLQPSDRPSIPSNLQTLESITSQKALRSLMDWGGLTVEDGFDHPTRPEE